MAERRDRPLRVGTQTQGAEASRAARPARSFLVVNPERQLNVVRGLASPVRIRILRLLRRRGALNVNQIAAALELPQSTIATNVQVLEEAELIATEIGKATKGQQKICSARFDEIVIRLDPETPSRENNMIEVEMPLGLYTSYNVTAPCGMCSTDGIIGVLDVPALFLDPSRMKAALLWFGRGHVEYKFPNNAKALNAEGVPGPRGSAWSPSTIQGNPKRGIGILNNELYIGRSVWNRQQFIKNPDTGKRVARPRRGRAAFGPNDNRHVPVESAHTAQ